MSHLRAQPRRRALIALGGLGAALLSACGGGGGGGGPTPGPTPTVPTLVMESNAVGTVNGPITINFLFSDTVTGFGADRFLLNGAKVVAGSFTQITPREYTVQVAPLANSTGTIQLEVFPTAYKDATGTVSNTVTYRLSQPYDTLVLVPYATFNDSLGGLPWTIGPVVVTMTFNTEITNSFSEETLYATGATLSEFTRVSGTVYTVKVTPLSGARLVYVELPPRSVTAVTGGATNPNGWQWLKVFAN
ncbi:MAG: hypothetical protein KGQ67_12695 [Betaproteobacteria bacterium]|nr:hypothetical protein [Betaproteobacteria bacterium]